MRRHEEQRAAGIQPQKAELKASAPWLQRLLDQGKESEPKGSLRARARRPSEQSKPVERPATPPPRRRAGVLYLTPEQRHQNPLPPPPVAQDPLPGSGAAPGMDVDAGDEDSQIAVPLQRTAAPEIVLSTDEAPAPEPVEQSQEQPDHCCCSSAGYRPITRRGPIHSNH